ncbi:MAG: hypothetical protein M1344_04325 [Candidatus Thermoplasmatota archaeon]|nr:hypothetical protein [Candidatus Thermoplasmatota archaeon]MDA8143908.1 hypothetical protein [Thermoplasmatales archaeon]
MIKKTNKRPHNGYKYGPLKREVFQKKSKRLDMRKTEEFNYMLGKVVEDLPDSVRGAIKGSLYSIASKKGTREAKDYITKKYEEGLIDDGMQKRLYDLLADYSKFR